MRFQKTCLCSLVALSLVVTCAPPPNPRFGINFDDIWLDRDGSYEYPFTCRRADFTFSFYLDVFDGAASRELMDAQWVDLMELLRSGGTTLQVEVADERGAIQCTANGRLADDWYMGGTKPEENLTRGLWHPDCAGIALVLEERYTLSLTLESAVHSELRVKARPILFTIPLSQS